MIGAIQIKKREAGSFPSPVFLKREMLMKKISGMIAVLLAAVLALTFTAFADDTRYSYGHFYYHDHDGYVSIAGYLGSETDIEIPSSIAGKPVSEIESGAFDGCGSIERITVPDTVVMVYGDSFTGAGSLRKIICEAEISGISAPAGVDIVQPEVTTPAATSTATVQTFDSSGYHPPVLYTEPTQTYRDNTPVLTGTVTEDTTQPVVLPEVSQDEDIGDFAYEEDFLPDETESVTAAITIAENIVTVSVNDSGQLVGIDDSGNETVIDTEHTYAEEKQPDGSVKIVDEDGEELVIAVGEIQIAETTQETTAKTASAGTSAASPSQQTASSDNGIVIVIIAVVAAVVVIAVIIVIVMIKKRR